MQNQKQLLPIGKMEELEKIDKIKYKEGYPRQYRWNAKNGTLNLGAEQRLNDEGDKIVFLPISMRLFKGAILNYKSKRWLEFFFINQVGQLSSFMIHGFSVENFLRLEGELFYDDATAENIIITLKPKAKTSEKGNYYIAEFSYEILTPEQQDIKDTIINSLSSVYKLETAEMDVEEIASFNYNNPFASLPEAEIKKLEPKETKAAA